MAPKKNKKNNKRKLKTPQRFTRANPIITDTETEVESQPDEVPDNVESDVDSDQDTAPTLPNGEWYMPDLNSTTLTEVIRKGNPYEGDNTGRILTKFPKLTPYTKSNLYLVSPFTGEIDLYDPANSKCIAFPVKATRERIANSTIITQIRAFMRKQNEEEWKTKYIPGEDIPTPTTTPHTITTLAEIMQVFEEVCRIQGETNLKIHQIKIGNDRDKWLKLGFRTVFSERIRDILTSIYSNLATDVALRASLVPSTPTNAGTVTASAARRVAFSDEPQDITNHLVQLSTTSSTDPLGRTGRPSINPEGPWHQQCPSPNSVSSFNSNEPVRCYKCGIVGHVSSKCSRKAWCDNCKRDNHATAFCFTKNKPVNTSTPKLPNQEVPQASVHNSSAHSSNDLLQTKIESDTMQKNRKYRMKKIANYDGTKRDRCISWLIQVKTAAKDIGLSLREALLDTADGTVYEVISAASSSMSDRALTEHILETF